MKPEHFGYESAQVLLIGESNPDHALEPARDDQRSNKETPLDELLKLEHEDEERVQELKGLIARLSCALIANHVWSRR